MPPSDEPLDIPEDDPDNESPVIRKLRKENKDLETRASEAATLRRENALLRVGLTDLSEDRQTALLAVIGDDFSPETVKAKAVSLGYITEEPAEPQTPDEERQAIERTAAAAVGADPAGAGPSIRDQMAAAQTLEELDQLEAQAGIRRL